MRDVVFIRDKVNKHSMRALIAAFEKWFPDRTYKIVTPERALTELKGSELILQSFATRALDVNIRLADELRSRFKDINTICGGAHPSAKPLEMLEYFDSVCTGEGEITIKNIVEQADDSHVSGIIKGEPVANLDDFMVFPRKMISLGPIEIIRGCPSRCAYCQTPQLFPGKLRMRSIDFIIDEIRFALSRKGFADARFIAPDASSYYYDKGVNINAIEQLLSRVRGTIGGNGKLFFGTFPSELDPKGVTPELVELLTRYCDNKLIVLGLQSASKRMTKLMSRRSDVEDTEKAIELLLNKGFEIVIDLIYGLPFEDDDSYKETYKFVERWRGKVTIHAHPFDPLPGSRWADEQPSTVPEYIIKQARSLEGLGCVFGRVINDGNKC